jgi:hypothetical protein
VRTATSTTSQMNHDKGSIHHVSPRSALNLDTFCGFTCPRGCSCDCAREPPAGDGEGRTSTEALTVFFSATVCTMAGIGLEAAAFIGCDTDGGAGAAASSGVRIIDVNPASPLVPVPSRYGSGEKGAGADSDVSGGVRLSRVFIEVEENGVSVGKPND